jgi:CBS domain-containing protein
MKIQDIMTFCAKTVEPDATIKEAATIMKKSNVGFLPVVKEGKVVGILTDRDIVVRGLSADTTTQCVRDLMTGKPITIPQTADLPAAVRLMSEHKIGRLPVVDEERRLKGVVSANDIARASSGMGEVVKLVQILGRAHQATGKTATLTKV